MSRSKNSELNMVFGMASQILYVGLSFISRTIFIKTLGTNYLGLNGLFTNILSVLSLADLGIGSAIMFSLYIPIAKNDNQKIKALMNLYKKAYMVIGIVVLLVGLAIIPFLKYIVRFNKGININYTVIYILFLANTVVSYLFFAYRSVIIEGNQKSYMLSKINCCTIIVTTITQIICLVAFKNYYIYLVIPILFGIVKNLIISIKAGKMYPIINESNNERLSRREKRSIFKNIYALSLIKISNVVYGSTDNIVISTFLGTVYVGIYSNYLLIITAVTGFINIIFSSFRASLGNLNAVETKEYKFMVFKRILLMNFWIVGFCSICLYQLLNPFIQLWIGNKYLFNDEIMAIIVLMFLVTGLNQTISIFEDACGLFWLTRHRAPVTAMVNLFSSIFLVNIIGITGVFWGTIISFLTTIYLIDPKVVYSNVFKIKNKHYYLWLLKSFAIIILTAIIVHILCGLIKFLSIKTFILQAFICTVIPNIIFYIIFRNTPEFKFYSFSFKKASASIINRSKKWAA